MTVYCKLSSYGNPPTHKIKSLSKAIDSVIKNGSFKKYESKWQKTFRNALKKYASRTGVPEEITESFYLTVSNNHLSVKSTKLLEAQRFEYGWDDDVDDDDYNSLTDYSMTISTISPQYYIRPAMEELREEIAHSIKQEVWSEFEKEAHKIASLTEWHTNIPTSYENTNYFQKYSDING